MDSNYQFIPVQSWGFGNGRPFLVSGPCGAESAGQVNRTAGLLAASGSVNLFRAGVWKPRTRPGDFEGRGEPALQWLSDMKTNTGMPFTVEVVYPEHVELALKYGADVLWVGARTSVNPFMMQHIADALKGADVPVMIKNPVNPDLRLWIGAIERIYNSGINRIAAVHRGFSSYENSQYRNKPNWEIPIELKRRLPGISLLCDPSHICGSREPLQYISQFAMDLNYEGLMIESHIDPSKALSDAKQQITPEELDALIGSLILRNLSVEDVFELSRLEDLRDQIDETDDEIIATLAERMAIARSIGEYKYRNNMTILQPKRWEQILESRTRDGMKKQLTENFLIKLYGLIHEESIHQQTKVMNKQGQGLGTDKEAETDINRENTE